MSDSLVLDALKRQIALNAAGIAPSAHENFTTGYADLDSALRGRLKGGRLHELYAAHADDAASAAGFAAMLALRVNKRPLAWLRTEAAAREVGQVYMPGLAELGGDPGSAILLLLPDDKALLRTAADVLACAGLGAVLLESWGNAPLLTLTASRRLALAADKSGVSLFLLRIGAEPVPSAATTRWRISSAPSVALAADAPGHSRIDVELLRQRSGPAGMHWKMEWDRDERVFRKPEISGAVAAMAEHRTAHPQRERARRSA